MTTVIPSFSLRKDAHVDQMDVTTIKLVSYPIKLDFTGPATVTADAVVDILGDKVSLTVRRFSGTASGSVLLFTATLPAWIPLPPVSAGMSVPVTNNAATVTGFIAVTQSTAAVTINSLAAFTATAAAGLTYDATLEWRI